MAEATTPAPDRFLYYVNLTGRAIAWSLVAALGLLIGAQLAFFSIHAAHMLHYLYPLDYGEGPLLAQIDLLRSGTPIWQLYADPDRAPYAIVNYPPVYHLATLLVTLPLGDALLAGRLVSLAAALAAVGALGILTKDKGRRTKDEGRAGFGIRPSSFVGRLLIVLAFLALPIVREWSVVMRVDMLGVGLGLCGLVIVQRSRGRALLWAALPLALSLLVKPSLIAAPAATLLWLLFRDWRRALLLGGLIALVGGLAVGALQLGSGGWFLVHVLAANANVWDRQLAYRFWHDQMLILWPLVAAAALSIVLQVANNHTVAVFRAVDPGAGPHPGAAAPPLSRRDGRRAGGEGLQSSPIPYLLLPLYYTLFGAIVAFGVGKVGAYTNYFLEFYAGLIWLAARAARRWTIDDGRTIGQPKPSSIVYRLSSIASTLVGVFVIGSLLRYYPIWSESYLKLAGIIEGRNPPRMIAGGYGVWQDLRRERDILTTLSGVNATLVDQVQAAGAPIFTDVPGVAAQANQLARLQVFEYRQLLDAGLADQRPLLRDMANGRVPLVVLDYLGNWLTPEMIALITHRYAQDGSRGTYDLYRPVDPGPAVTIDLVFPAGLRLAGYHLAPSLGRPAYHGGETALLTLEWRQAIGNRRQDTSIDNGIHVVVQLTDGRGRTLLETSQPLLYGALRPSGWGNTTVQHMQPIALPPNLPAGTYRIAIALRAGERDLAPPQDLAPLIVEPSAGRQLGENGFYVPALLLEAWARLGGDEGPGDPLMPATPFQGYTLQCFARACLKLAGSQVQQLPLGELVHLADVGLPTAPLPSEPRQDAGMIMHFPETGQTLADFLDYWREHGGADVLGPPITPELIRGDRIVQYTRYARLERPQSGGRVRMGRLGEEFLRLPGGVTYRWPYALKTPGNS
jgi:hypothetical protein